MNHIEDSPTKPIIKTDWSFLLEDQPDPEPSPKFGPQESKLRTATQEKIQKFVENKYPLLSGKQLEEKIDWYKAAQKRLQDKDQKVSEDKPRGL